MNGLKEIKIIILDVDGTLTDGKIYYDSIGNEMKSFNVKDGMAISQAIKNNIDFAVITGRESFIVEKRCKELGIRRIYQGVHNKLEIIDEILLELNINYDNIMYIGDDINDLKVIENIKYGACPSDAAIEIREKCFFVSKFSGGNGAVREILEYVLKEKGIWDNILKKYVGGKQ